MCLVCIRENTQYILTNPVKEGLVRQAKKWPGAWSAPRFLDGGRITVKRLPVFFKNTEFWPDEVAIHFTRPPGFEDMTTREYRLMVTQDLKETIQTDGDNKELILLRKAPP